MTKKSLASTKNAMWKRVFATYFVECRMMSCPKVNTHL